MGSHDGQNDTMVAQGYFFSFLVSFHLMSNRGEARISNMAQNNTALTYTWPAWLVYILCVVVSNPFLKQMITDDPRF